MNASFKTIFHNFTALSAVQLGAYVFPLITVPYLGRVLGAETFGLIAFAQAFALFFTILSRYGFNLSATRTISIDRDNPEKVGRTFCEVMTVKLLLAMIFLGVYSLIVFQFPRFQNQALLFLISYGVVFGDALFPVWFFQGMERMKPMALLNIVSQAIFTAGIFIFVRGQEDYLLVALLHSSGFVVSGVLAQIYVLKNFRFPKALPSPGALMGQLQASWHFFVSSIAINIFTSANVFLLGLMSTDVVVGYFSAAEKLIRAVLGLLNPVTQAVYPPISRLAANAYQEAHQLFLTFRRLIILITILLSIGVLITAKWAILLLMGPGFEESVVVLQIMALLPLLVGVSTVYTNLYLVSFGHAPVWTRIVVFTSLYSIIGVYFFVEILNLDHIGVAINMLITEAISIVLAWRKYRQFHLQRSAP